MATRFAMFALVILAAALVAGCTAPEAGQGSASVYVKDAPADEFDEIHVVFTQVAVHAAGSGDDDDDEDDSDENETDDAEGNETDEDDSDGNETDDDQDDGDRASGWKVLFSDASGSDIDLLNATGTRAAFLGESGLAAGKYTQLRVTVTEVYGIQNGTRVPITLSSGTLKLNHPFEVEADAETRLVLDFDLEKSLHQSGNGSWRMTPVVGSVDTDEVDDEKSGKEHDEEGDVRDLEDDE
ncbi:MAG TPA: DUF4382 domain-containing protein [Candidatus Thermoplasmatota archaeon]|nr:DUF4382 domain-containing protein [Candidatus Thermoplasmatota archaeon]